jgi:hypothetical protein
MVVNVGCKADITRLAARARLETAHDAGNGGINSITSAGIGGIETHHTMPVAAECKYGITV